MSAPTGLYGHVHANERRSLLLFAMFAVAFQLLGFFSLAIPLLLFDPDHTSLFHPLAYAKRYVPVLFAVSTVAFAAQMWWFIGTVRKQTRFHYVDSIEEPRFCRILEPLAMTAGITIPFAGVIETRAMNAFAAGVRGNHMVVVATRGLIDGLDDAELAAVLANTVIHIRNRDTRLLAAASIFMRNMTLLYRPEKAQLGLQATAIPMQIAALVIFPIFIPLMLVLGFFMQIALRIAYGSRALIGVSRELIADAESVRLTHDPAALASALQKIDRNNGVSELRDEHAAMLVVGVTQGPLATHPTVDERIGALARTTGSMVLDTGPRLDTRPAQLRQGGGFGRRLDPKFERIAALADDPEQRGFWGAFRSVRDPDKNIFGLNRKSMAIMAVSVAGVVLLYQDTFRQPDPLPKLLNMVSLRDWSGAGAVMATCENPVGRTEAKADWCEQQAADAGKLFGHLPGVGNGMSHMLTFKQQQAKDAADDVARGCYGGMWDGFARSRSGAAPLDNYMRFAAEGTQRLQGVPPGPQLDAKLKDYAEVRMLLMDNIAHFYGDFAFAAFSSSLDTESHRAALAMLAEREKDPTFLKGEFPRQKANLILLARRGTALKPCWLEKPQEQSAPS